MKLLNNMPWMTLAMYLFTSAFLLSAVLDQLPKAPASYCAAAVAVAGKLGKALYALAQSNGAAAIPADAGQTVGDGVPTDDTAAS